ncbi:MAG TPA: FtsX-like permease family protein [Clostridia bacterium]|nr:FtsX-like permease family protein [Clostridia bacterium]
MKIIIKFILKNMYEKKLRTFLILFSIILSSALFFAAQAITDNVVDMFLTDSKQFYGNADIMVFPETNSPSENLKTSRLDFMSGKSEYVIGALRTRALYKRSSDESVSVAVRGTTIEEMNIMCPFYVVGGSDIDSFSGRKIVIGKTSAEKYGIKIGDQVKLEIGGKVYRFLVCAIAQPDGYFAESSTTMNVVVPKSALSSIYGRTDVNNIIFIGLKDGVDVKQSIEEIKSGYRGYSVEEPVPVEDARASVESMSVGFMMMTIVVAFMSLFIIYTSFKVITLERMPIIGTFRSVGATKRTTNLVLLGESLAYGIIGGALGCALGLGVLYLITLFITPNFSAGYVIKLIYTPSQMAAAFGLAVGLSVISSVLPIRKISKIPVKEIVLNAIEKKNRKKTARYIGGLILLVLSFILPPISPKQLAYVLDTASMMSSIIGLIMLLPLLVTGFVKLFEKIYTVLFGNVGAIAAKNLRENKSILNNISILAISISTLIMITTISDSALKEVASFFTRSARFDVWLIKPGADRSTEQSLLAIDGIQQVCGSLESNPVEIIGTDYKLSYVNGIDTSKYPSFYELNMDGDKEALLRSLDNERSIILTSIFRKKAGFNIGDNITLKLDRGNFTYKVIGFQDSILNGGGFGLISDKYFKADTGIQTYNEIYIKTDKSPDTVIGEIKNKYRGEPFDVITMKDLEEQNYAANASIFRSMEAFAYLAMIIGIFGIINNYVVSFIERKRSLAMYRSIGMSRGQIVGMMIAESATCGIIGGSMGVIAGLMMVYTIPYVMEAMDFTMPILLNPSVLIVSFLLGAVITLVASLSPIKKTSRMNLIEALKYE